jgi:hypothetical protein
MVSKFGALAMLLAMSCLAGCYNTPPTKWSTVVANGYYGRCATMVACVVSTRGTASASVANYNGSTTVTSSTPNAYAAVATNSTSTALAACAGNACATVGTSGTRTAISTSAGSYSSASLAADGGVSSGTTTAGTASNGW